MTQAPGETLMWPYTVTPTRPPGASTRCTSAIASGVVPQMPRKLVTTSKDPSSQGMACMSPTRMSASGLRSRAISRSRGDASMPAQIAPRAPASSSANPAPQATSRRRSPASHLEVLVQGHVLAGVGGLGEGREVDGPPPPALVDDLPLLRMLRHLSHVSTCVETGTGGMPTAGPRPCHDMGHGAAPILR